MLRRYVSAAVVLLVLGGFVVAETVKGIVTSIDEKEVKVKVKKEEKTFKVSKDTKITVTKKGEDKTLTAKEAGELVAKAVEKSKAKGAPATIEVDGEKATSISFGKKK
jgi:hypothetical protein